MSSWVESLPSGRYRAVYRDDDDRRHGKSFDRKTDAKKWLASAETDRARGQWVDPRGGAMLFGEWGRPVARGPACPANHAGV